MLGQFQIRITGSLLIIYRELIEDFSKIFPTFSGNGIGLIVTKLGFE